MTDKPSNQPEPNADLDPSAFGDLSDLEAKAGETFANKPIGKIEPTEKGKKLLEKVGELPNGTKITKLDAISSQWRQTAVKLLKELSPADYEKYRAIKFEGVPMGQRPSLDQSRAAYLFAMQRFLEISYAHSGV